MLEKLKILIDNVEYLQKSIKKIQEAREDVMLDMDGGVYYIKVDQHSIPSTKKHYLEYLTIVEKFLEEKSRELEDEFIDNIKSTFNLESVK